MWYPSIFMVYQITKKWRVVINREEKGIGLRRIYTVRRGMEI
jgi:hypothetical protein